jgi:predicted transcriptional regulator
MKDNQLKEQAESWRWRIRKLGMTIKEFCEVSGVNYNTFHNLHKPSKELVDRIEREITKLEGK